MQQGNNPLLNSLILSTVFSYCGLEELKRCRLVCHLWKEECRPHIRKRAKTIISKDLDERNKFTVLMNNADYLPMSSFYFLELAVHQVEPFSMNFGPSVNIIRMNCKETNIGPIYLFSLLGKFSNLKELQLKNLPTSFHTTDRIFSPEAEIPILQTVKKISLTQECSFGITLDLLNMCPNMISFKFGWSNDVSNQIKALKCLDSNRHSKIKIIKIKGVYLGIETALEILSLLTQSKFELEQLTFSNCSVLSDRKNQLGKLILQLFQQQSETLQKLVLPSLAPWPIFLYSTGLTVTFPQMVALREIAIQDDAVRFSFPSISLSFPNLKILDLKKFQVYKFNFNNEIFRNRNNIIAPNNSTFNLHTLLLPANLKASQQDFIVNLANIFPLVQTITVIYKEPEILEHIWKSWPNLIALDISETSPFRNASNGDRDIEVVNLSEDNSNLNPDKHNAIYVGLEASDCFQLSRQDYCLPDFTIEVIKPSIRDLKELRMLKLSSLDLTDVTGYLGISALQKLIHLELKCPKITQTCLDALAQRLPSLISWSNANFTKK